MTLPDKPFELMPIHIVNLRSGNNLSLNPNVQNCELSPSGDLAVLENLGETYVLDLRTMVQTQIALGFVPAFWMGQNIIMIDRHTALEQDIQNLELQSYSPPSRRLSKLATHGFPLAADPEGKLLVAIADARVTTRPEIGNGKWVMVCLDAKGNVTRPLTRLDEGESAAVISPSAQWIAFAATSKLASGAKGIPAVLVLNRNDDKPVCITEDGVPIGVTNSGDVVLRQNLTDDLAGEVTVGIDRNGKWSELVHATYAATVVGNRVYYIERHGDDAALVSLDVGD